MSGQRQQEEPRHEVSQSRIDRQTQPQIRPLPASLARLMNTSPTSTYFEDASHPNPSSAAPGNARNSDIDRRRDFISSRRETPSTGDPVSPSVSTTSEDLDFHRNVSAMDPRSNIPTTSGSDLRHGSYPQRHQSQRLSSSTQGIHNVPSRPRSAADNAYLSDLSTTSFTSSARGAPPPSQASVRTSTSLSSESSSARVLSWQREQSEEIPTTLVGPGVGLRRQDYGHYPSSQQEIEYESRSGRRTHFPVSTMRGGSTSSRSYQYSYAPTATSYSGRQGRTWADEREASWSESEPDNDSEVSLITGRGRGRSYQGSLSFHGEISGSEVLSTSTSPLPSERSTSAHSSVRDMNYIPSNIQAGQRYGTYRYLDRVTTGPSHTLPERFADPPRQVAGSGLSPARSSESPTGTASHFYPSHEAQIHSASAAASRRLPRPPGAAQAYTTAGDDPYTSSRWGSPYTSLSRYAAYSGSAPRLERTDELPHMRRSLQNSPISPVHTVGNYPVQYPYPPEAPIIPPQSSIQAVQGDTPPSSKRAKTSSTNDPKNEEDTSASKGKRKGSTRGRGRGKKALGPPTTTVPATRPSQPVEPPAFWGRDQHVAGSAELSRPGSSTSIELADTVGQTFTAGPSSLPRNIVQKISKGDEDESESQHTEQESVETQGRPPAFVLGPASTEKRRIPREKIEVACHHCRKRKMKCDGGRPSCQKCLYKNLECAYSPVVRRRGPGKHKKKGQTEARPKKTNKAIEGEKKSKGKGKAKAQSKDKDDSTDSEQQGDLMVDPALSGPSTSTVLGQDTSLSFTATSDPSSLPASLPLGEVSGQHAFSIDPSISGPTEQIGHSLDNPDFDVHVTRGPSTGSSMLNPSLSESGAEASGSRSARFASTLSSGQSSSEGEHGRRSGRRRAAKRMRIDDEEEEMREEGEIREAGPPDDGDGEA